MHVAAAFRRSRSTSLASRSSPVAASPLVPCDKLEMKNRYQSNQWFGTTSILLLRVGERRSRGWSACTRPGFRAKSCRVSRPALMGLDNLGVASYLLTLYFSCAVLTDDALGVLEKRRSRLLP